MTESRTRDGLELFLTIAGETEVAIVATAATVSVLNIYAAALFVLKVIDLLAGDDDDVWDALDQLQTQIDDLKVVTERLGERLDDLVLDFAMDSNRHTFGRLRDYLDAIKTAASDLALDADPPEAIAIRCGIIADKFLANSFDIWRWTDVVRRVERDPITEEERTELDAIPGQFKNLPTLPVYILAVLTWLGAIERAVAMNRKDRVAGEFQRLRRHLAKLSSRPDYDQFADEGSPESIAEHIKYEISSSIQTATRYPQGGVCRFSFLVNNWMTGQAFPGESFYRESDSPLAVCMVDPRTVGPSRVERDLEDKAGIAALAELEATLQRMLMVGTLQIPRLDPRLYDLNHIYAVMPNGELQWYVHQVTREGSGPNAQVSHSLYGPRRIGSSWDAFVNAFHGGYRTIYALRSTGEMMWQRHDGFMYGTSDWTGPTSLEGGWEAYAQIIPGADGVLYGVTPDGRLMWHRHRQPDEGVPGWDGPIELSDQWDGYGLSLSAGQGILYSVRQDGTLVWHRHQGFLTGAAQLSPRIDVSIGWQWDTMRSLFSPGRQTIYGVDGEGELYWYQHTGWLDGTPSWIGPVRLGSGWNRPRILFARMSGAPTDDIS